MPQEKQPMTQKELTDLIFKWFGLEYCDLSNEDENQLALIERQLSLLYAKAERWDELKKELSNNAGLSLNSSTDDIIKRTKMGILLRMKNLESTPTETKTEGHE